MGLPGPHVLVGDLNLTPTACAGGSGLRTLAAAPTFPPIDRDATRTTSSPTTRG